MSPMSPVEQELEALRRDMDAEIWRDRARQELAAQIQAGIHREEGVEMYAHCGNPVGCDDRQERVLGVKVTTNRTYADSDPSCAGEPIGRMIENSHVDLEFLHDEDRVCERCQGARHLSLEPRPVYSPLSGHDPRGLVEIAQKLITAGVKPTPQAIFQASKPPEDERVERLEQELAELKALIIGGNGHAEGPVNPPAAATARVDGVSAKGWRKRGEGRFEALLYRSESPTGKQKSLGTFATVDEAIAARTEALS